MDTDAAVEPIAPIQRRRQSLSRRYAVLVGSLSFGLLLSSGVLEMYFSYREARQEIARSQQLQARGAAQEIAQYMRAIETGLRSLTRFPWGDAAFGIERMREEFYRLMVLYPALTEVRCVAVDGRERLFVSRSTPDRRDATELEPSRPDPAAPTLAAYGMTTYDGAVPHVDMSMPLPNGSNLVAKVNLRFLADVVSGLRVGDTGSIYVVDAGDRLIAHPRASQVLRRLNLAGYRPLELARRSGHGAATLPVALDAPDLDGRPSIATAARVDGTDWLVIAEQPRMEALQPALATLSRTLLLVAVGGCLAVAASAQFARRMASPIVALRAAAGRIAGGDLDSRIAVSGGDEIESLARDFNDMASKLRESYGELERKVVERTMELSAARDLLQTQAGALEELNRRLLDQLGELSIRKEEADRASSAKTRFLAAASHDLRQPMHSVSLLMSVLRDRLTTPDHSALADKVLQSIAVMERLFASLLDISKLDAGAIHPNFETVHMQSVLMQIEQTFAPQATSRGLRLRVRGTASVCRTDPALLERIVNNLVGNAIRYTREGGVLIGCRRQGPDVVLQISDTGIGIASEHQSVIFEEFVRLDEASGGDRGLGLGLSIVRRTVDLLGHRLRVDSVPGRGSTFRVTMPAVSESRIQGNSEDSALLNHQRLNGLFVLIADDDEVNREAMKALCEQWGCRTATAASAESALAELGRHLLTPDLLVTDYRFGHDDNGLQLIARLRGSCGEDIPAVILSADANALSSLVGLPTGVSIVSKPASARRLLRAILAAIPAS